ncbi:hypothetical protein [Bdellovibrio sp. HCB-162]|uniref:hypothetical protein n=1 Tax=Bdellovibrio sp. HCB-162 TaxID=3394234 RepID=UPI0039BC9A00
MKTISLVTSCTFFCALLFAIPTHASANGLALSGSEMVSSESSNKMKLVDAANYCRTMNSVSELRADGPWGWAGYAADVNVRCVK